MSFRARLTVFFVAIVVVPMIAVAVLVLQITEDSRNGKADARLAAGLQSVQAVYGAALDGSGVEAQRIANSPEIAAAMRDRDRGPLERRAEDETEDRRIAAVRFLAADGQSIAAAGPAAGLASSRIEVELDGEPVGSVEVAGLGPQGFAEQVTELTGNGAIVVADRGRLAGTVRSGEAGLPSSPEGESVELGDDTVRAAALPLDGAPPGTRVVLVTAVEQGFLSSEPAVLVALVAFFALAVFLILLVLRMLQGQVAEMLAAARRIGAGDFSGEVPVEGRDEMAGLASEFNKMSARLSEQMDELKSQRQELQESVRRIGEAFAAGLDRTTLLQIVADTAVSACEGEAAEVRLRSEDEPGVDAGEGGGDELSAVLQAAAHQALDRRVTIDVEEGEAHAIAHPLSRPGDSEAVLGTMAVARRGRRFDESEREVLRYLIGQAEVSVENIGLHERVSQQAFTDELTGLSNNRHFREWIDRETERAGRFGTELSLVLLDVDDFKQVNDEHGHLQGDAVLGEVGRVLKLESRGIDEAARYGGEEFVLALPETPTQGAVEVAERVRERIEATEVAGVDGNRPLRVTASVGVATMPRDGKAPHELIAAADAALYRAKRAGKNRVVAAAAG